MPQPEARSGATQGAAYSESAFNGPSMPTPTRSLYPKRTFFISLLGAAGQHLGDQLGSGHGGQACVRMAHEGPPVTAGLCSPQKFQRGPSSVNNLCGN